MAVSCLFCCSFRVDSKLLKKYINSIFSAQFLSSLKLLSLFLFRKFCSVAYKCLAWLLCQECLFG